MTTVVIIFLSITCLSLILWVIQIKRHRRDQPLPPAETTTEDILREFLAQEKQTARFLRDEVVANLSGLGFGVTGPAKQQLKDIARVVHDYTDGRLPFVLGREGLLMAVSALVAEIEDRTGVTIDLASQETSVRYAFHQEWAIYQLIEALLRQSVAGDPEQYIEIHLGLFDEHVVIRYQQNGQISEAVPRRDAATQQRIKVLLHLLEATGSSSDSSQQPEIGWYARIPVQRRGERQSSTFQSMLG